MSRPRRPSSAGSMSVLFYFVIPAVSATRDTAVENIPPAEIRYRTRLAQNASINHNKSYILTTWQIKYTVSKCITQHIPGSVAPVANVIDYNASTLF